MVINFQCFSYRESWTWIRLGYLESCVAFTHLFSYSSSVKEAGRIRHQRLGKVLYLGCWVVSLDRAKDYIYLVSVIFSASSFFQEAFWRSGLEVDTGSQVYLVVPGRE